MKQFWIVSAMVVGSLAAGTLLVVGHDLFTPSSSAVQATPNQDIGLPWDVQSVQAGQIKVVGVTLGHATTGQTPSTLADIQRAWGANVDIAIIAAPGETGALEAFIDPAQAGFITGKLILTLNAPAAVVQAMRERAIKSEFMESTTRKYRLTPSDLSLAATYEVSAMAFIPQANLDEGIALSRFGQPAKRLRSGDKVEHFLYPNKGLDLTLNSDGKDVLQFVAPADFDKLQEPLEKAVKP